jgi:hypothetical protein
MRDVILKTLRDLFPGLLADVAHHFGVSAQPDQLIQIPLRESPQKESFRLNHKEVISNQ